MTAADDTATAEDTAWEAYRAHVRGCTGCHTRLHNCETGRGLWGLCTAARGPIPGWQPT